MEGFCFVPWAVVDDPTLTPYDRAVYLALCRFSDRDGACFPSLSTIAARGNVSLAQVKRAISKLESRGFISRERRRGEHGNESTLYHLLSMEGRLRESQGRLTQTLPLAPTELTLGSTRATKKNHITRTKEQEKRGEEEVAVPRGNSASPEKALLLAVVELYHRTLPGLPAIRLLSTKRRKAIGSLIGASSAREDLGWWQEYFGMVSRSPWLLGENSRGWTADLDWLLNESNMAKVLEGKYLPKSRKSAPATGERVPRHEGQDEWTERILAELNIPGGATSNEGRGL